MTTQYDPSRIAIAIPARMESKRLPGKPLVEVGGKPLLQWAWEAASACGEANLKFVVTDSQEIEKYCLDQEISYYFSRRSHDTGTDRIAEAIFQRKQDYTQYAKLTHVINLQCDEPDITGEDLDRMARELQLRHESRVATFSAPLQPGGLNDRNAVKVVVDYAGHAIYFSRWPLAAGILHIGVYGMSVSVLRKFSLAQQPPLEVCEQLEQMRFLYNRNPIYAMHLSRPIRSINTPEDVKQWFAATT